MSLRFIYGRAGSGKSYYCLNEIKSRIDSGKTNSLILLVPEQFSLQAERNLVKTIGTGGIIKAEVLSFKRMAYRVFNEVGGLTYTRINSAGKCMVIHKILENMKDDLRIFSKSVGQQGFVNAISDMIAEFKRYNVMPEDLEKGYKNMETNHANNSLLKEKLKELALIYREYENTIHEKYRDADDDLTILCEKLDKTAMFNGAEIWIDEFSGFTSQEYKVIAKLMDKAYRVNVSLCTDCLIDDAAQAAYSYGYGYGYIDYTDVFSPVKNVVKKLMQIAKESNIPVEPPVIVEEHNLNNKDGRRLYRFKDSPELEHLERYFFSFPYKRYTGDGNFDKTKDITIFTASNIYTEIECTARDIIRLCRDRGLRYRDITVVCGDLDVYEKLIRVILAEYDIPCFIDKKREVTKHPLVQLIISVFEIFIYNWSYEAVFRYLKTGLTGIPREDIDLIENYVLACGIRGNKWAKEEYWEYIPEMVWDDEKKQEYQDLLMKINDIRRQIITPLMEFHSRAAGRKTAREICEALFDLLCVLEVPKRMDMYIDKFKEEGELNLAGEYGQIWNITMEILDQAVELMGSERMGLERFLNILKIGFGEHKTGLIPPALDQVLVGNIERSKTHEVEALYILGVNDGVFPVPDTGEKILSDKDRGVLQSLGLELASDTRTKAFEDQYMVYSVLTTARKYLRLSVPIADHEGRTLRPSITISRIRKLFPNILETGNIVYSGEDKEELELISGRSPTYNELLSAMRKAMEGHDIKSLWQDVYLWYVSRREWRDKCTAAQLALTYTNLVAPIEKEKVRKLYGNPVYSSVSRFEKYASCPFAYYIQYGLKAKERRIFNLTHPDIGTFLHGVLEEFSRYVAENGISWRDIDRDWCAKKVAEISDRLLENMQGGPIKNGTKRYKIIVKRLDRVLFRAIWLIVEHIKRSSFEPVGYEIDFGSKDGLPPINIELPTGEVIKLTGRVDRVDALETGDKTYIRIIDYKSGSEEFSLSNVYYGVQIQLIAYLYALWGEGETIRKTMGEKLKLPIMPGGILYFKIDDPIIRNKKELTEKDIEKAIMKELKMRGLLLADVKVIKEMDKTIDGDSLIIPARINKGDVLGKASSAATIEQFNTLCKYVRKLLENLGMEMLKGDISIKPYKNKKITSCQYCNYTSICQFDPVLRDNRYRILTDNSDEEIWKLMELCCGEERSNS
ncbi:MAG: helicase-exonuclease AddAB subunit AddB [Firmicutes bacterium]|nr:helicase-exonuclease AddAB subunit AddB [Bacillota bacterium]